MLSGMMMPHELLAINTEDSNLTFETSDGGKTITITSTKAGALAGLKFNGNHNQQLIDALTASSGGKIVFVGDFCEADLKFLNGQGQHNNTNYCTQKIVDMSEAKFVNRGSSSANTYLYHFESDRQNKNEGDHCIVGATKYKSERYSTGRNWHEIDESEIAQGQSWQTRNISADDVNSLDYSYDVYLKLPTTLNYYQLVVTTDANNNETSREWVLIENPTADQKSAAMEIEGQYTASDLQSLKQNYSPNQIVKVRPDNNSFKYFTNEASYEFGWQSVAGTYDDYQNGTTNTDEWYSDINEAPAPTDYGQWVIAGGTEYVFHNGQWVDPSQVGGSGNYDYTQMKFDYWGSNVEEIITSKYAEGRMADQLCNSCTNLKTLTLSAGDFALAGTVLGNNINSLETVNIQKDVTTLSSGMFNSAGTSNNEQKLETVNFEDGCQIKTLPTKVFLNTGIKNLTIPSSVELIEAEAFHSCYNLETVTFVNTNPNPLIIKNRAFQNSAKIKDVYIEVAPEDRKLICEYNAFDFASMEAQTQIDGSMTTLHFPEDSFDYYAGEWKKGMAFTQSELNAFKDGIEIKDDQGNVIYANPDTQNPAAWGQYGFSAIEYYSNVDGYYHDPNGGNTKYAPGNGWQQFAKTASNREIYVTGNIYMTYSTDEPYSLPEGIIAFRITDYVEPKIVNGKTTLGKLVLKKIEQVPTETGMLLISTDKYKVKAKDVEQNPNIQSMFFFGDPVGTPEKYHYEMGRAGGATSNYLAPAVHGIEVGPVSKGAPNAQTGAIDVNGSPFTHRNFAMNKNNHQFVRVKHITMPDNRAFLSLPKEMFTNNNESATEGPNPWNTVAGDAFETYETTEYDSNGAKTTMFFEYDVEKYGMIWPLAQNDETTGISQGISTTGSERVQEGIFTLQGVKVTKPVEKGIYLVNGKKVIIK